MTLEQKLLTISKAVKKHGIDKLSRRILCDLRNPDPTDIDRIVERIESLEARWNRLKKYLNEHGISNTAHLAGFASRMCLRRINYLRLEFVLEKLDYFEVERLYELEKIETGYAPA